MAAIAKVLEPLARMYDDGLPDMTPVTRAVRESPARLLNPIDLVLELFRPEYFRRTRFDGPDGDPGWFGPNSAAWYVHAHAPTMLLGLLNTAMVDIIHNDIQYAVFDHSKLVGRKADGSVIPGTFSTTGTWVRAGRSFAFFLGVVMGSTETADSLARTVKAMHSGVKGHRPDGKYYDADDPEFFRWTYATVVDGIASAHERYHPRPLRGAALDAFYADYARVGEALGGVDLPTTQSECRDVLNNSPSALEVGLNGDNIGYIRPKIPAIAKPGYNFFIWMIMDMMPHPIQRATDFSQPGKFVRRAYRFVARTGVWILALPGDIREVRDAKGRVFCEDSESLRRRGLM